MTAPTATEDPRIARSRAAVIEAAAELLAEEGMSGFSIDAVSRRSGVARTTIYRHWPESRELFFDAFRSFGGPPPLPDTGSIRDDMVAYFRLLVDHLQESRAGSALPVLLDATLRDPTMRELHRRFVEERRAAHAPLAAPGHRARRAPRRPRRGALDRPPRRTHLLPPPRRSTSHASRRGRRPGGRLPHCDPFAKKSRKFFVIA